MRRDDTRLRTLLAAAAVLLPACSLVNAPDRESIELPMDAGTDAGTDANVPDARLDAGPPDAGMCPRELGAYCGDGIDNDCDDAPDCDDVDCASAPQCCSTGGTAFDVTTWSASLGGWAPASGAGPEYVGGALSFGADGTVRAIRRAVCVPLALGARIAFSLDVPAGSSNPVASESGVVATAATEIAPGAGFADDVALVVTEARVVELRRGGRVLASAELPPSLPVRTSVTLELAPGADGSGRAVILASASYDDSGPHPLIPQTVTALQSDLFHDAGGCRDVPGLYLAFQGKGDELKVYGASAVTLACANPSQFNPAGAPIVSDGSGSAVDLGASAGAGMPLPGIGEPSLFRTSSRMAMPETWQLWGDVSAEPRDDELTHPIRFRTFRATSGSGFTTFTPGTVLPELGGDAREPGLLLRDAGGLRVAVARERAGAPGVHDLVVLDGTVGGSTFTEVATVRPDAFGAGCASLRDPALVFADEAHSQILLYVTCDGARPSIHAGLLEGSTVREPTEVLAGAPTGFTAGGVRAPAPIVRYSGTATYVRMWFVAIDGSGRKAIGLAEGQGPPASAFSLALYPINPVLRPDTSIMGAPLCDAASPCAIKGIGVFRDGTDLRLLLARRVDPVATDSRYDLVPLRQTLEAAWGP